MALTVDETTLLNTLSNRLSGSFARDGLMGAYYEGSQRLEHIGLAVPPELRRFETVVNWPRVTVDSLEERLDVKSLMLPDQAEASGLLREGWDANNLDSESSLAHLDAMVYGRTFVSVGANAEDSSLPLISVESPRELTAIVDPRTRRIAAALRLYGATEYDPGPMFATLYLPDRTVWLERGQGSGRWVEYDRDQHNLGRVPVVMFLNRRRTGDWCGVSEMSDVIPLTDAAARALTNLQLALETHAVPRRWALGMTKGDFVDKDGNVLPTWQAYFGAIWGSANPNAKFGQFDASDLKNFHETVNHYASLVAGLTGLPMRYLGQNTQNPPSADGIRADEARLVKRAERKQRAFGDQWAWVLALYVRFKTGEWVDGNRIKLEWYDAATPTYAAKVDGIQKLTGGEPILSREGGWDELGWSEARKDTERARFASEPPAALEAPAA